MGTIAAPVRSGRVAYMADCVRSGPDGRRLIAIVPPTYIVSVEQVCKGRVVVAGILAMWVVRIGRTVCFNFLGIDKRCQNAGRRDAPGVLVISLAIRGPDRVLGGKIGVDGVDY